MQTSDIYFDVTGYQVVNYRHIENNMNDDDDDD